MTAASPSRRSYRAPLAGLFLATLLVPSACSLEAAKPVPTREVRLGPRAGVDPAPITARPERPAQGLLLSGLVVHPLEEGRWLLQAWLDGRPDEIGTQWSITGADLTERQGEPGSRKLEALVEGEAPWTAELTLGRKGRSLGSQVFSAPPSGPSVTPDGDRLQVGPAPQGARVEVFERLSLEGLSPGDTRSLRWVWSDGRSSPWMTASSGSLPSLAGSGSGSPVPLQVGSCKDSLFPRQTGRGHLGCSAPAPGVRPRLDQVVERGASLARGLEGLPSFSVHRDPIVVFPHEAGVTTDPSQALVWAGATSMGLWGPGKPALHPLPNGPLRGRPVAGGGNFAFARPDRIEHVALHNSARYQLPARPLDTNDILAINEGWLASLEGQTGEEELLLRHLKKHRSAPIAVRGRPARPLLLGPWLIWEDDAGLHGLPLEGGQAWTVPLRTDRSVPPTVADDWLLLRSQSEDSRGLVAVHVPTGHVRTVLPDDGRGLVEPRGAGAGRLTLRLHEAGRSGELRVFDGGVRIFEEDGPRSSGDPLSKRAGGHSGSSARLEAGRTRRVDFDPGVGSYILEAWIGAEALHEGLQVRQGRRRMRVPQPLPPSPEGHPGHWVPLGTVFATGETPFEERQVLVEWTAPAGGLPVDALRLVPQGSAR